MIRFICEIGSPITHRFSTAIRNPLDKSNATYPDEFGDPVYYPVLMKLPKIKNKLSDSISGSIILGQQTITIENSDGAFDDVEELGWFNIPITVKRSDKDDPLLSDFNTIYTGIIDYPVVGFDNVQLKINNIYRALTQEVTELFNDTDYPNIPEDTKDDKIPIGYGPLLKRVSLFQIDSTDLDKYVSIEPDYIVSVDAVYDSDDISIPFTVTSGIIDAVEAQTADVAGLTNNKIGQVIQSEIALKSGIPFTADNWDIVEVNEYISSCANINFYFDGGTVRQLVDKVLKNDNAFLFTKNNGLLTIRQWGRTYKVHELKNWKITKFPKKNYANAQKNYNSQARLLFDKNQSTGDYDNQTASGTTPAFDKERVVTYRTDLFDAGQLEDLGTRLIRRFGELSEDLSISTGDKTGEINLLDLVILDVNINGRQFSKKTEWVVIDSSPSQDVLVLEARSGFIEPNVISGVLAQPLFMGISGVLGQVLYDGISGTLSQPIKVIGEQ